MKTGWSIKSKLLTLCSSLIFVIGICGTVGWVAVDRLSNRIDDITDIQLPAVRKMGLIDMMHDGLSGVVYRALYFAYSKETAVKEEIQNDLNEMSQVIKTTIHEVNQLDVTLETKKAIKEAEPEINNYVLAANRITSAALSNQNTIDSKSIEDFQKAFKSLEEKLEVLSELIEKDAEASQSLANQQSNIAKAVSLILGLFSFIIGGFASFLIVKSLLITLKNLAAVLTEVSQQVASVSTQIAASSSELSQSTTEQASSLDETASALEEISSTISKSSENAQSTAASSKETHHKAEEGRAAIEEMLVSMDKISDSNEAIMKQISNSNEQMTEIVSMIQDIGIKTKVINEIVFQTKLLSFNASVEAARAGEHGKGFAVVAEEVGKLAQMSGNAAKEISEMLEGSISKVEKIVDETKSKVDVLAKEGKERVTSGIKVAQLCSSSLNEIVHNIERVSTLAGEISLASREQSQGVGEINKAMSLLEKVTQQNAATSEQAASSAGDLSTQAHTMKSAVDDLVLAIDGGRGGSLEFAEVVPLSERQSHVKRQKAA